MKLRMATTTSHSASFWPCCINIRRAICAIVSVWLGLMICGPIPDALALPRADEFLKELHISDSDQRSIRDCDLCRARGRRSRRSPR